MQRLVDLPRPYSPLAPIRTRRRSARSGPESAGLEARRRAAEIGRIAGQLARVAETVPWGRVQDNRWDQLSRFVYRTRSAASARTRAEQVVTELGGRLAGEPRAFVHYALRRWYCFWGARMAELLFQTHPGVQPGPPRHHEVDFTIDGQPFDLKTSELPRRFLASIDELTVDPGKVVSWLYQY